MSTESERRNVRMSLELLVSEKVDGVVLNRLIADIAGLVMAERDDAARQAERRGRAAGLREAAVELLKGATVPPGGAAEGVDTGRIHRRAAVIQVSDWMEQRAREIESGKSTAGEPGKGEE